MLLTFQNIIYLAQWSLSWLWWGDVISVNLCYQTQTGELLTLLLQTRNMKLSSQQLWSSLVKLVISHLHQSKQSWLNYSWWWYRAVVCKLTSSSLSQTTQQQTELSQRLCKTVLHGQYYEHIAQHWLHPPPPGSNNDNWVTMVPAQTIMNDAEGIFYSVGQSEKF